jgi:hypothetical protein
LAKNNDRVSGEISHSDYVSAREAIDGHREVASQSCGKHSRRAPKLFAQSKVAEINVHLLGIFLRPDRRIALGTITGHSATDGKHRFCAKMESDEYRALLNIESWSLETGAGFTLTQGTDGTPLTALSRKDFLKRPVPLKMPDGYQAKTMRTADGRTILIYLRNYQKAPVMQTDATPAFEWFALRSQSPVPLTLHFTLDDRYELKILDLDTRQWMDARTVSAKSSVGLGISSHDYVLVLTR